MKVFIHLLSAVTVVLLTSSGCGNDKLSAKEKLAKSSAKQPNFFDNYASVTAEVLEQQPRWTPDQPLPKSINELTAIAIASYTPSAAQPKIGWTLSSIIFFHVPDGGWPNLKTHDPQIRKDRWYCQITIAAYGDYKGEWWKNDAVINMFLDGTLITPR